MKVSIFKVLSITKEDLLAGTVTYIKTCYVAWKGNPSEWGDESHIYKTSTFMSLHMVKEVPEVIDQLIEIAKLCVNHKCDYITF